MFELELIDELIPPPVVELGWPVLGVELVWAPADAATNIVAAVRVIIEILLMKSPSRR